MLVNKTHDLVQQAVNVSDEARVEANTAVELATHHGLQIPATVGRVLEVADCPWCHPTSLGIDGAQADPELLTAYLRKGVAQNSAWAGDVGPAMNHTADVRTKTRTIMSAVLRAAAESNGNFSSKHAQVVLKRQELEAEQGEVHELAGKDEKQATLEGARGKVGLTEERPPINVGGEEVDLPAESTEPEVSPAHKIQMERASKMRLSAETSVARAAAHDEAEAIRGRVMAKALASMKANTGGGDGDRKNDDVLDELSVVSQLSALRQQVGLAQTAPQRVAAMSAFRKYEDVLVAKLANQRLAKSSSSESDGNGTMANNGTALDNSTDSDTGREIVSTDEEGAMPCENCSDSIAELKVTLSTQNAKIVELEQRQAQNEKSMEAAAISKADPAEGDLEAAAATGGSGGGKGGDDGTGAASSTDGVPSTYEDCIDGDCDLLKALPSLPVAPEVEVPTQNTSTSNATIDALQNNSSSVCLPVSILMTNTSCPHKVVSVSGRACAGDLGFADAQAVCEARGMGLCKHAELERAYNCGFRSESCGWTKTVVKAVQGNLIERLSEATLQICDISSGAEKMAGSYCCER